MTRDHIAYLNDVVGRCLEDVSRAEQSTNQHDDDNDTRDCDEHVLRLHLTSLV